MHNATPNYIVAIIAIIVTGFWVLIMAALINQKYGTHTVIETYNGTKSVCSLYQFNYNLRITQCMEYKKLPAVCNKIQHTGPIFPSFVNINCE